MGMVLIGQTHAQVKIPASFSFSKLNGNHDIAELPAWGPYSKHYAGISHVPDLRTGMRFDFSVMPGYYRNKVLVPNVRFESGYYPWQAAPDLRCITYRYELEWKDRVYVDVTYTQLDSASVLVAMHSVNQTALPQNLALNLMASIEYPESWGSKKIETGSGATWVNAVDYSSLSYAVKKPTDDLVHDGWKRGEVRDTAFIDGRGIGEDFGRVQGDRIAYSIALPEGKQNGTLSLVYKLRGAAQARLRLSGLINREVVCKDSGAPSVITMPYNATESGSQNLVIESTGGGSMFLNGFVVSGDTAGQPFRIVSRQQQAVPATEEDLASKTLMLKYADVPVYYGIRWDNGPFKIREFRNDELDIFFRNEVHNHVAKVLNGNQKGDYANVFIRPIELKPFSSQTAYALLSTGTHDAVAAAIKNKQPLSERFAAQATAKPPAQPTILPGGKKYLFSRNMLQAALLSNVVYPIYTQDQFIRHFTPGKWWNSLYTWDLGFTALGLTEVNPLAAIECVNAYVTPPGSQSAFIHHGSPLPVQMYVFLELWNRTQSKELLTYFYPRLKQYYEFLAGRRGSSTTAALPSHLLKTWDYFYNSAGWDDYPPQAGVHEQHLESRVTPVATSAHVIRVAKILRMAARALDSLQDLKSYDADIDRLSKALQAHAWDSASGYFSYVVHDSSGKAAGFFKDPASGANFNMGLDGAYPLVAGICTPRQQEVLLDKIFSPKHMWSPSGITVVDQSAPYYRIDGYWNGSVWMPHQWFVWKTMIDLNRLDLAQRIAMKGLDVWQRETDASYYTFEHFLAASGRGAGWHQFSGLSTPVLSWFSAYFKPGTVTPGFETWIMQQAFNPAYSTYRATLNFDQSTAPHPRGLLVCMDPAHKYRVIYNGKAAAFTVVQKGLLQITLPAGNEEGRLEIMPVT